VSERRLPEAGRPREEDVVEGAVARLGGADPRVEVLDDALLTDEVLEAFRAERLLDGDFLGEWPGRRRSRLGGSLVPDVSFISHEVSRHHDRLPGRRTIARRADVGAPPANG
jgi:hypothetical protein